MSLREERRMVFDMLAGSKITVKEAEALLDALEGSAAGNYEHDSIKTHDFTCCDVSDSPFCADEFEPHLEEFDDFTKAAGAFDAEMGDLEAEMNL